MENVCKKTKNKLDALKKEYIELNKKLAELTEDELKEVIGGSTDNHNGLPKKEDNEHYVM